MSFDSELLKGLREAGDGRISEAELSHRLKASRASIRAHVEELRSLGYDIEASPHLGYGLLSSPDALHADDLVSRLGKTKVIGRDIRIFAKTTSTNNVVEKLASDGLKEGVVVFAEAQTQARGRLGRKWLAPARKGLWFSILLRPRLTPQETTRVTVASATAIRRVIESETTLSAKIKWPNDIVIGGRKVSGILTELHAELDRVKYVVLGIGVNVNLSQSDFPVNLRSLATSLKMELGRSVARPELAAAVLEALDRDYARISSEDFPSLADEWEQHCETLGHQIIIRIGEREIRGRAESLDEDGALLLRSEHGHLERIIGGDVTLEK